MFGKVLKGICWIAGLVVIRAQGINFDRGGRYSEMMVQVAHPPSGNPESTACFYRREQDTAEKAYYLATMTRTRGEEKQVFSGNPLLQLYTRLFCISRDENSITLDQLDQCFAEVAATPKNKDKITAVNPSECKNSVFAEQHRNKPQEENSDFVYRPDL